MTFAPDEESKEALHAELRAAVEEIVRKHGGISTKFVLVGEVAEVDGEDAEVGCWLMTSAGIRSWDTMGLLRFALKVEDVGLLRSELEGE